MSSWAQRPREVSRAPGERRFRTVLADGGLDVELRVFDGARSNLELSSALEDAADALRHFRSTRFLRTLDAGRWEDSPFIAFQVPTGTSLDQLLGTPGLTSSARFAIASELNAAVKEAASLALANRAWPVGHGYLRPEVIHWSEAAGLEISGALVDALIARWRDPAFNPAPDAIALERILETLGANPLRRAPVPRGLELLDFGLVAESTNSAREFSSSRDRATVSISSAASEPSSDHGLSEWTTTSGEGSFSQATVVAPAQGRVVAGLRLGELLGGGSFSEVYRGEPVEGGGPPRAVKLLRASLLDHPGARRRMLREGELMRGRRAPNLVEIVDYGETSWGVPYMVLGLVRGVSLAQLSKTSGPLPPSRVSAIGRQIATALSVMHDAGLVHRDVKPDNVMVDAGDHATLLDFGLVRPGPEEDATRFTQALELVGTPAYMAPEQILAASEVGPAADLYSLGATLYALLRGRPPFQGDLTEVLAKHRSEPISGLDPDDPLEALILELLAKDPAARPASADVVIQRLSEVERTENEVTNTPPGRTASFRVRTPPAALGRPAPAPRSWTVAGLVVLGASLLTLAAGLELRSRNRREARSSTVTRAAERPKVVIHAVPGVTTPTTTAAGVNEAAQESPGRRTERSRTEPVLRSKTKSQASPAAAISTSDVERELRALGLRIADLASFERAGQLEPGAWTKATPEERLRLLATLRWDASLVAAKLDRTLGLLRRVSRDPSTETRSELAELERSYFELRLDLEPGLPPIGLRRIAREASTLEDRIRALDAPSNPNGEN